ncbi:hypothetical protein OIU79_025161 [Salix purpurea]|uniref:Uncharacterized protein n=1 Tax=Salix purpurea TaxID=77065 RepID=A0A9Q0W4H7_SALPP|nr:hypothetical protein OIU79_025161 [Salix purpurea]KAJ6760238.1 hypothetical protein OIU79_025161 [Salix purpurea]KAJ6760241.1 hypothetical protein OIU79_025161 [Salix purpurea]KAJ6760242.1 hypothetical protein OIU79_025161 [Salix purpurea]KAJ6760243.1 hypothetical protein OIU79_025161 [Salix purpurea]
MEVSTEEMEIKVLKSCKCGEFEKRIVELEWEIQKKSIEYHELEAKFKELGERTNGPANEVNDSRANIDEVKEVDGVVDLTAEEEEDKMMQLMIENKVLEFEKKNAAREVEVWKEKYKELELYALKLNGCVVGEDGADATCNTPGTPLNDIMQNHTVCGKPSVYLDSEGKHGRQVRKILSFEEERSPRKKIAPSTPGYFRCSAPNVINVGDSDDEFDTNGIQTFNPDGQEDEKVCISMDHPLERTLDSKNQKISDISLKGAVCNQIHKEYVDAVYDNVPHNSTPKRKRPANVIASDTESDEDDNAPISKLKRLHLQESIPHVVSLDSVTPKSEDVKGPVTRSRQRLATLRKDEGKVKARISSSNTSETNYHRGIPTKDDVEDSESDDAGSESEGGSLDGFIVSDDTYVSDVDDASSESEEKSNDGNDAFGLSDDGSDDDTDFGMILSRLHRSKDHKFKWEFEGDMLADFR